MVHNGSIFELLDESQGQVTRPVGWIELATRKEKTITCYTDHLLRYGNMYNSRLDEDNFFYLLVSKAREVKNIYGINILPQHQMLGLGTKILQLAYTLGSEIGRSEFCIDYANPKTQATVAKSGLEDIPELRRDWSGTDTMSYVFGY